MGWKERQWKSLVHRYVGGGSIDRKQIGCAWTRGPNISYLLFSSALDCRLQAVVRELRGAVGRPCLYQRGAHERA